MHFRFLSVAGWVAYLVITNVAHVQEYTAPRGPGDKPDLNGVWQVLNRANYDVEAHQARAALQMVTGRHGPIPAEPLVPLGAVPGGFGVVVGGALPYKPDALAKKAGESGQLADPRTGDQVLSAGSSPGQLHAISVSDCALRVGNILLLRICGSGT